MLIHDKVVERSSKLSSSIEDLRSFLVAQAQAGICTSIVGCKYLFESDVAGKMETGRQSTGVDMIGQP